MFGGNFGKKDADRAFEGRIISDRGKSGIKTNSMIKNYISSVNNVVYAYWPLAEKNRIILVLGWMFFGTRKILRIITGKREKPKIIRSVKASYKRRDLYDRLGIFDVK